MLGNKGDDAVRVMIELEDIITSVDKQSTYVKIKTKIGSLNGVRETKTVNPVTRVERSQTLNVISRSDTLIDNAQETFFELVATKAITNNVHNRWGAKKVHLANTGGDTITEIMINMQSIDVKLELDILSIVMPIVHAISPTTVNSQSGRRDSDFQLPKPVTRNYLSVRELPLVFFKCKGFQMWIPTSSNIDSCDVLIFKVCLVTIILRFNNNRWLSYSDEFHHNLPDR